MRRRALQVPYQSRNVGKGEKGMENFASMIECAKKYGAAVRIGVNWGSLDQALLARMMDENNSLSDPLPPTPSFAPLSSRAPCRAPTWP